MSNPNRHWCQDVSRDEAVRAAEDAAAVPAIQHRDLPDEVALLRASVTDILGRVVRLEGEIDAGKVEAVEAVPPPDPAFPGEGMRTERVTLEFHIEGSPPTQWPWSYILNRSDAFKMRPGESVRVVEETEAMKCMTKLRRERDAARAECERLKSQVYELQTKEIGILKTLVEQRDSVSLSLEVALDRVHELEATAKADFAEHERLRARVAELEAAKEAKGGRLPDMVAWITAERDAARAEAERLRDRVAELEAAARTAALLAEVRESEWRVASDLAAEANAENAGGEAKQEPEPRGWLTAEEADAVDHAADIIEDMEDDDGSSLKPKADALRAILARPSSEPWGWLTAEERRAVGDGATALHQLSHFKLSLALRALLARSSPPRVKVPPRPVYHDSDYGDGQNKAWKECAAAYTAAIREAGGEVAE